MLNTEPSSAPVNFYSEAVVQLTAMLVWSPPPVRDHNGVLLGYKLSCISDKSDNISVQVEGATTTITDLTDHAHYTCTVCAYTLPGCGPVAVTYISTYDECKYRLFVSDCKMSHIHILCITLINSLLFLSTVHHSLDWSPALLLYTLLSYTGMLVAMGGG